MGYVFMCMMAYESVLMNNVCACVHVFMSMDVCLCACMYNRRINSNGETRQIPPREFCQKNSAGSCQDKVTHTRELLTGIRENGRDCSEYRESKRFDANCRFTIKRKIPWQKCKKKIVELLTYFILVKYTSNMIANSL